MKQVRDIVNELKHIQTVGSAFRAENLLEKIFWALIGILGIAWAFYFLPLQYSLWTNNPAMISLKNVPLSDLDYPSLTLFPNGITKYAIAERLGNYLNPDNLPVEWQELRKMLFDYIALQRQHDWSDERLKDEFASKCGYGLCEV